MLISILSHLSSGPPNHHNDSNSHFDILHVGGMARRRDCIRHMHTLYAYSSSTMTIRRSLQTILSTTTLALLLLDQTRGFVAVPCHVGRPSHALATVNNPGAPTQSSSTTTTTLQLYDNENDEEPVPRFVAKNNNNQDVSNQNNDTDHVLHTKSRLFDIQSNGREARDLLPPLSRSLISGIECYFESTDRAVQNLAEKTACHPMDAAWALEACKGDVTEAWLCISTARKMLLNEQQEQEEEDFDADLFQMLQQNKEILTKEEENYDELKERLKQERRDKIQKDAVNQAFSLGKEDGDWLPTPKNKQPFTPPIDDEPWFTG